MARADESAEEPLRIRASSWNVDISGAGAGAHAVDGPYDYSSAPDEVLVDQLAHRDVRALEAVYDRYGDIVYSVSLRVVGDIQLAEDVAQEVFLRLWRKPDQFDESRGRFLTWLLSVARNRAIDERRTRGRRSRHETPVAMETEALFSVTDGEDPESSALVGEERMEVRRALLTLPQDQRVAIELAYFRGYTQVEIARGLHQPLGTVKTRIRLGLQKLRISLVSGATGKRAPRGV